MTTAAIVYCVLIFVGLLAFGVQAWRQRRDVWVPMHSACMFQPGDEIKLNGTAGPAGRARVLKVTRSALLVRPIK